MIPKRHVKLQTHEIKFPVTTWDTEGRKYSAIVTVKRVNHPKKVWAQSALVVDMQLHFVFKDTDLYSAMFDITLAALVQGKFYFC